MIYLDHSATTKIDEQVMDTYVRANENFWGNASSLHHFGALAEQVLIKSNRQILEILHGVDHQVILTSGATESNNLALKGLAENNLGGHLITTKIEHPSIYEVCQQLGKKGIRISYLDVTQTKEKIIKQLEDLIEKDTFLVSCMHVNSEMGLILPIEEIGEVIAKYPRVKFHVDAVQSVGKMPVDITQANIDLMSISAHKIHGPKGVGALIIRRDLNLAPELIGGGQMEGLRSGTVNVAGGATLAKALRLVTDNQKKSFIKIQNLYAYTCDKLSKIDGVQINRGVGVHSPYIINFTVVGVRGETMVHALEAHDVYISAKSACSSKTKQASYVLLALGFNETVATESLRISFAQNTTLTEVDKFLEALQIELRKLR